MQKASRAIQSPIRAVFMRHAHKSQLFSPGILFLEIWLIEKRDSYYSAFARQLYSDDFQTVSYKYQSGISRYYAMHNCPFSFLKL